MTVAAQKRRLAACNWVDKAEEDLEMAVRALQGGPPLPASACFHAQQCAEKYMKALLISENICFKNTHDLFELAELLTRKWPAIEQLHRDLDQLGSFAVRVRYPGSQPAPPVEAAVRAHENAEQIKQFCRERLGSDAD